MKTQQLCLRNLIPLGILALLSILNAQVSTAHAQGTAFTYQGRLDDNGAPANGVYDLRFRVYNALTNGSFSGGMVDLTAVPVSNGLFTVTLAFNNQFLDGSARWLEVAVKSNSAPVSYTFLAPRQAITPTPYAITASNVTGVIADGQLSANVPRLNSDASFTGAVEFSNAASQFAGMLTGVSACGGFGISANTALNCSGSNIGSGRGVRLIYIGVAGSSPRATTNKSFPAGRCRVVSSFPEAAVANLASQRSSPLLSLNSPPSQSL